MPSKQSQQKAAKIKQERAEARATAEAEGLEVTDAAEWKKATGATKLKLPSGFVCLAQNMGMMPFVEEGVIPNSLLPLIMEAINEGRSFTSKDTEAMMKSPDMIFDMIRLMNTVVVRCVIKPVILPIPVWNEADVADDACSEEMIGTPAPSKKDDTKLYADEVDDTDKQFVFQWVVGGTRDLERFRDEQAALLADVLPESEHEPAAQ